MMLALLDCPRTRESFIADLIAMGVCNEKGNLLGRFTANAQAAKDEDGDLIGRLAADAVDEDAAKTVGDNSVPNGEEATATASQQ